MDMNTNKLNWRHRYTTPWRIHHTIVLLCWQTTKPYGYFCTFKTDIAIPLLRLLITACNVKPINSYPWLTSLYDFMCFRWHHTIIVLSLPLLAILWQTLAHWYMCDLPDKILNNTHINKPVIFISISYNVKYNFICFGDVWPWLH